MAHINMGSTDEEDNRPGTSYEVSVIQPHSPSIFGDNTTVKQEFTSTDNRNVANYVFNQLILQSTGTYI